MHIITYTTITGTVRDVRLERLASVVALIEVLTKNSITFKHIFEE